MKEIRDKGLCYYWEAKWQPCHKRQKPKLYLVEEIYETQTEAPIQEQEDENTKSNLSFPKFNTPSNGPKISLYTIISQP